MFQKFHGFSHPGIKASIRLITARFVWPNMKKNIQIWTRACINNLYIWKLLPKIKNSTSYSHTLPTNRNSQRKIHGCQPRPNWTITSIQRIYLLLKNSRQIYLLDWSSSLSRYLCRNRHRSFLLSLDCSFWLGLPTVPLLAELPAFRNVCPASRPPYRRDAIFPLFW